MPLARLGALALATHPRDLDISAVRTELRRVRRDRNGGAVAPIRMRDGGGWLSVHPIQAAGDSFGHVCLLGDDTPGSRHHDRSGSPPAA